MESDPQTEQAPGPRGSAPRAPWASAISLAEAGLLADVAVVFDLAWVYVPIIGTVFMPLVPTPFVVLYLRRGAKITLFSACAAGFLMTVLVGPHYGWRLTLEGIVGLTMGWVMKRRWAPSLAIVFGTLINTTVAYAAAFGAAYALGLPIHNIYLELRNLLISVGWMLDTGARLFGVQANWLSVRPAFAQFGHLTLTYWLEGFYLYTLALALPTSALYYMVASTTAYALGYDVRPFPAPWVWRALRVVGVILSPVFWVVALLWRVVTLPLWGPVWVARALGRWRRRRRLRAEMAAFDVTAVSAGGADPVATHAAALEPELTPVESPHEVATVGAEASE